MVRKYLKKCSTSLAIKKIKIMICNFKILPHSSQDSHHPEINDNNAFKDEGKEEGPCFPLGRSINCYRSYGNQHVSFHKFRSKLLCDSIIISEHISEGLSQHYSCICLLSLHKSQNIRNGTGPSIMNR